MDALDYALLDAGDGRRLERFGGVVVERPAAAATDRRRGPAAAWEGADARFVREGRRAEGEWILSGPLPEPWLVRWEGQVFELEAGPAGQVGLFPEGASLRARLAERVRRAAAGADSAPRVLDLFAHTGAVAMAAAAAGASVVAVDSSRGALRRARRNLERAGLDDAPVRTIAEDVARFVAREERRGSRYRVIVLDPPSFGRGPKGETWKIERDLDDLLGACRRVLADDPLLVLLTAHTEAWTEEELARALDRAFGDVPGATERGALTLTAESGATLGAGLFALRSFAP